MSSGAWSQFSPNLQHPMPTMATLSRIASGFMSPSYPSPNPCPTPIPESPFYTGIGFGIGLGLVVLSSHGRTLPKIIRRSAELVDLPKRELHRQVQLGLFRGRAGRVDEMGRA